jgi:hypothetical protein
MEPEKGKINSEFMGILILHKKTPTHTQSPNTRSKYHATITPEGSHLNLFPGSFTFGAPLPSVL